MLMASVLLIAAGLYLMAKWEVDRKEKKDEE